jgi:hypothetical protein
VVFQVVGQLEEDGWQHPPAQGIGPTLEGDVGEGAVETVKYGAEGAAAGAKWLWDQLS